MPVFFHNEDYFFLPKKKLQIKKWINTVISGYSFKAGQINYIFTSDRQLLKINQEYLDHDFLTDIITFDYTKKKTVSGDIFISIERVRENAEIFETGFNLELKRVIIHGILHMVGFKDKTDQEKKDMKNAEDQALSCVTELLII